MIEDGRAKHTHTHTQTLHLGITQQRVVLTPTHTTLTHQPHSHPHLWLLRVHTCSTCANTTRGVTRTRTTRSLAQRRACVRVSQDCKVTAQHLKFVGLGCMMLTAAHSARPASAFARHTPHPSRLIVEGSDVNERDKLQYTPLHYAARTGLAGECASKRLVYARSCALSLPVLGCALGRWQHMKGMCPRS